MQSEQPDPTLLNDEVFNIAAFYSAYSYLSLAAAKLLFGQLNFPNIWTQNNIFTQEIQVGTIGQFGVSSQGHCNMASGQIDDEIPIETNNGTIASTQFVHSVQDAIFASDNTWTGTNIFDSDAFAQTANQNTAQTSTLIATLQYTWESINTLLNIENTWTFLQHFTSGIETNTATITGLLSSNAITTNTLTISTSATTPNVSQANTPDTSIANTAYIWASLGTFLTQPHTWTQTQSFADISSTSINGNNIMGNIIVGNAITSNGALTCVDLTSSNSITANSALFNTSCRVPNVSIITPPGDFAANTQHVSDVIAFFLSQSHAWPLDQHFMGITAQLVDCSSVAASGNLNAANCNLINNVYAASCILSGNVVCLDLIAGNSISANAAIFAQQCNVPTISQMTSPSTSASSTQYVTDSIATFLSQSHTWPLDQHFPGITAQSVAVAGNVSAANCNLINNVYAASCILSGNLSCNSASVVSLTASGNIAANNCTIANNLGVKNIDAQSLFIRPPLPASSSPFDRLQNALTIGSIFDPADCLILTSSRSQDNGTSLIQSCIDNHDELTIIYTPLSINPYGGLVAINKEATATISPNTIALDISGNVMCSGDMSANACHLTHGLSCESVSTVGIVASANITANNISATNQMSANALVSNTCTIAGTLTGNTCTLSGALICDTLRSSAAANLTITPSTGHHTVISSGNLNISAGNINMHGGLYCDNTVSGLVFTGTTLIVDNVTSSHDINLNGNFYAANTYGIQHRLLTVAYMINGSSPNTMYPLICSVSNIGAYDSDDSWIVAPGYHIYLYSGLDYDTYLGELDNTNGFQPLHATSTSIYNAINSVASVKVYYHLTQITIAGIS